MVTLATLHEPLSPEGFDALCDSIREQGQREPILRDRTTKEIVAGRNREAACRAVDVEPRYEDVDLSPVQRVEMALISNRGRALTVAGRADAIDFLRHEGWSDRRIAGALGVDHETVRKSRGEKSPHDSGRRVDTIGRRQFASKPTVEQIERRRTLVGRWWQEGYKRDAISVALHVSHGTIQNDLTALGIEPRAFRRLRNDVPDEINWRDLDVKMPRSKSTSAKSSTVKSEPVPERKPSPPLYLTSRVLYDLEALVQATNTEQYEKTLAWQVIEAGRAHDDVWLARLRDALTHADEIVGRLYRVVTDQAHRETTAYGSEALPDPKARLRVVDS